MKIDFVKINPTENMTILVKSDVETDSQLFVGTELMKYGSVYAEQVGFIQQPSDLKAVSKLRMMAGEFCGNGTMALAAYIAFKQNAKKGTVITIPLEVSGSNEILMCYIEVLEQGTYKGTVKMPLPLSVAQKVFIINKKEMLLSLVEFEGIEHVILPKEYVGDEFKDILEWEINSLNDQIDSDAYGIIVFDEEAMAINPLVVIKSAKSLYWERGCGSGSEAIGIYLAERYKKTIECEVNQPGGIITVNVEYGSKIENVSITGLVKIVLEGTAYI